MSDIKTLLSDLSSNPAMAKGLKDNLSNYNLSDDEKATLTSGDPEAIHQLVSTTLGSDDNPNVVVVIVVLI